MPRPRDFNLKNLITWLKTKDPDETYEYVEGRRCVLAQFAQHLGFERVGVGSTYIRCVVNGKIKSWDLPKYFNGIAHGGFCQLNVDAGIDPYDDEDWSFGAALKRALEVRRRTYSRKKATAS